MHRKLSVIFASALLFVVLLIGSPGAVVFSFLFAFVSAGAEASGAPESDGKTEPVKVDITLARDDHWLVIKAPHVPGKEIRINYLEAYCRAGSTDADWVKHTMVGHKTETLSADAKQIKLRCKVNDGLVVEHDIRAVADGVTFDLTVTNPTDHKNEAEWAQPCIRLGDFAGGENDDGTGPDIKLARAFIFLNGKLTTMPMQPWAAQARYTPGQVWCPKDVPRTDVNPRPLSTLVPDNGLIGCFSRDAKWLFAVVFDPAQELFQGVAQCLHNDFRIGQVPPGQSRKIRGRIWIIANDEQRLVALHKEWLAQATAK